MTHQLLANIFEICSWFDRRQSKILTRNSDRQPSLSQMTKFGYFLRIVSIKSFFKINPSNIFLDLFKTLELNYFETFLSLCGVEVVFKKERREKRAQRRSGLKGLQRL